MHNFWKLAVVAGAMTALGGISQAWAADAYFVIKSATDAKVNFAVTEDVIAKASAVEFKHALSDQDEDIHTVSGPRLRDILSIAGVSGKTVAAKAADDYEAEIPMTDLTTYDVIVAVKVDGKPITADENGPSRILYPVLDNPKLKDDEAIGGREVFALKQLTVK